MRTRRGAKFLPISKKKVYSLVAPLGVGTMIVQSKFFRYTDSIAATLVAQVSLGLSCQPACFLLLCPKIDDCFRPVHGNFWEVKKVQCIKNYKVRDIERCIGKREMHIGKEEGVLEYYKVK